MREERHRHIYFPTHGMGLTVSGAPNSLLYACGEPQLSQERPLESLALSSADTAKETSNGVASSSPKSCSVKLAAEELPTEVQYS